MQIRVEEKAEQFQLAFEDGWKKTVGHRIKINDLDFCATPITDKLVISEVRSGIKLFDMGIPYFKTSTPEDTVIFLETELAPFIAKKIKSIDKNAFIEKRDLQKKKYEVEHGKQPEIEYYDTSWITEEISDIKH